MSSEQYSNSDHSPHEFAPIPDPWEDSTETEQPLSVPPSSPEAARPPVEPVSQPIPDSQDPPSDDLEITEDLFKGLLIDLDELLTHHDSRSLGRDPDDVETIDDDAAATLTQRISKFQPIDSSAQSPSAAAATEDDATPHTAASPPPPTVVTPTPESAPADDLSPVEADISDREINDVMDLLVDTFNIGRSPQEEGHDDATELDLLAADYDTLIPPAAMESSEPAIASLDADDFTGIPTVSAAEINAMLGIDGLVFEQTQGNGDENGHAGEPSDVAQERTEPDPPPEPTAVEERDHTTSTPPPEPEPEATPEPETLAPIELEDSTAAEERDRPVSDAPPAPVAHLDNPTPEAIAPEAPDPTPEAIASEASEELDGFEANEIPPATPKSFEEEIEYALQDFAAMILPNEVDTPSLQNGQSQPRDRASASRVQSLEAELEQQLRELMNPSPPTTPPAAAPTPPVRKRVLRKPPPPPPRRPQSSPKASPTPSQPSAEASLAELFRAPSDTIQDPLKDIRQFLLDNNPPPTPKTAKPEPESHEADADPIVWPDPDELLASLGLASSESPPPRESEATPDPQPPEIAPPPEVSPAAASNPPLDEPAPLAASNPPLDEAIAIEEGALARLEDKVAALEKQVYEPTDMINPLVPLMVQLLKMKVGTSQDMVRAMATPILDEMITERAHENRDAMAKALGDLVPLAIEQQIQHNPKRIAKAIGPEVASAIQEQVRLERDAIATSLGPTIGRAIKNQIELERDSMVDALYPVIGSTVSRYMGEAIHAINAKVETAFSVDGLTRKVRARMQGVSEAELILQESIPVTVQAIFLIHKASGLVIAELQPEHEHHLESNMVAGMLTAIRSFVNDCIAQTGTISELSEIEYGDSRIILEVAGYCYLAVVVKGSPTAAFVKKIRKTLAGLLQQYGTLIEEFDGDPDTVPEELSANLAKLGQSTVQKQKRGSPKTLLVLVGAIAALIVMPWLYFQVRGFFNHRLSSQITAAMTAELDGVAYTPLVSEVEGKAVSLSGRVPSEQFKERAGAIAQDLAPHRTVENNIQIVAAPPDPVNVATMIQTVTALLNRYPGVDIRASYHPDGVVLTGSYRDRGDRQDILEAFKALPGIPQVDADDLLPQALAGRIYFDRDSAEINATEIADKIVPISEFLRNNPDLRVRITGHVDESGERNQNRELSFQRAAVVKDAIAAQGIDPDRLEEATTLEAPPGVTKTEAAWLSRCARFELITPEAES
ncbi:OmpA family protein [Spirulina major CS-329]|uniref:OmpA family protein n=1 Tax=Spirulina TaxID=1154 RepID=UPI00232EA5C2|nr:MULTISPECIES: OmpA family protein [Spirulina]MDB9495672.1 OmpA family protein [Spirulina subsalsa CS-330]MDB9505331.1 OmpA family protein [Spirulina major CS-329]